MVEKSMILVTWDFTEVSENALKHAQLAAKRLQTKIVLLNIVKKESEISATTDKLNKMISEKYSSPGQTPEALVVAGTIFTSIGQVAEDHGAIMIFMGTHGIKGAQKFFGSWALKVISSTQVPFVVVQGPPEDTNNFDDIVMPLNHRKENKEAINWLTYFSRSFGSKVHLYTAKHTDSGLRKSLESNILFLQKNLKSKGVNYTVEDTKSEKDFAHEVVDYATNNKADALFVMTTRDIGIADYMLGAEEQYIIANKPGIPVICITPRPPKIGGSFSTSGS